MRILAGLTLRQRLLAGGAAVGLVIVVVVLLLLIRSETNAASEQPIAFSHMIHTANQIPCQYCHSAVTKGPAAGIPSVGFCMGCHAHIATDRPDIVKLAGYWERQEPIPWVRVNEQPSYVHFTHQPHVAAGVSCGSCHGDVAKMDEVESVVNMNMGFCLDCHAEQDNKDALWDCAVCHY